MTNFGFNNDNLSGSIVNTGGLYEFTPCQGLSKPDVFAILKSDSTVSLSCRNLIIGGCTSTGYDLVIPFFDIKGCVVRRNCTTAAKKKVSLVCVTADCSSNFHMGITIVKPLSKCNIEYREWVAYKNWETGGDCEDKTCAQKIAAFVDYANSLYEIPVTFSIDGGNSSKLIIEAKVAGEDFDIKGYEGLNTFTVVTQNAVSSYYGKDFKGWGVDTCVPTLCEDDKCYNTIQFQYMHWVRNDRDDLGGSSSANFGGGSYYGSLRTVMLIADSTDNEVLAKYTAIADLLDGTEAPEDYVNVWTTDVYPAPTPVPTPVPVPTPTPTPV